MGWLVWVLVAVALGVGELVTPGLFFLGPSRSPRSPRRSPRCSAPERSGSLIVFIVCSVASLLILRPVARRHVRLPAISRTGTDALVGRKAIVTRRTDVHGGRVRIGGEEWTARTYLDGQVYEEGTTVDVIQIEGATALVAE